MKLVVDNGDLRQQEEDKYDAMALIAGPIAGLTPSQLPGLAHIFRQIAHDEREACANVAEAAPVYGNQQIAALIRARMKSGSR